MFTKEEQSFCKTPAWNCHGDTKKTESSSLWLPL